MDPFTAQPTLVLVCDVVEPPTGQTYGRDPRSIAKRAEAYLKATGIGDTAYFGPEAEFFVFDDVRFESSMNERFSISTARRAPTTRAASTTKATPATVRRSRAAISRCRRSIPRADLRSEMLDAIADMGVKVEKHHHEVAPTQHELGILFGTLSKTADAMQIYKYVVQNVAHSYGKTATFMPKPVYGDNGSGMHIHQSIWKGGKPLFAGSGYADLSEMALYYIGGIIKHAKRLNAFTNPTTNSYKRLIPGFEAPVLLAYSARNRSAACRIPFVSSPRASASRCASRTRSAIPTSASRPC